MSLRLALVRRGMRWVIRPILARSHHVGLLRAVLALGTWVVPPIRGVQRRAWNGPGGGLEFLPQGRRAQPVILWFHGGGYVAGSPRSHRGFLAQIARASDARVIAPAYRLAPEHPGGASFDDGLAACEAVFAGGLAPGELILGGDSAGGGLAAAVTAALCIRGKPPAGLIALSPWTDMTGAGASHQENAGRDDFLPGGRLQDLVALVQGDLAPDDPRLSPAFAHFPGLKRAYLSVGSEEILRDDMRRLAARLTEDGVRVTARERPGAPHVLAFLAPIVPEARAELRDMASWIADAKVQPLAEAVSR